MIDGSAQIRIDVAQEFNVCVRNMGGIVTDDVFAKRPDRKANADFIFAQEGVVAELKCLEKDWALEFQERFVACAKSWIAKGKLRTTSPTIRLPDMPPALVREICDVFRKRLKQNIVAKRNKQIKQSRLDAAVPHALGLLIVVNDGNLALAPETMAYLLRPILISGNFSAINTVLYMSVNQAVTVPAPFHEAQFWIPWTVPGKPPIEEKFLRRFANEWMSNLSIALRAPVAELDLNPELSVMQFRDSLES